MSVKIIVDAFESIRIKCLSALDILNIVTAKINNYTGTMIKITKKVFNANGSRFIIK
jgi:hypothetical protein